MRLRAPVPGLHAYKVGDWGRAKLALTRLALVVPASRVVMYEEAVDLNNRIQKGLWSDDFANAYGWPDLSESTVHSRMDPDNPMLIDTSSYASSIKVVSMGPGVFGVGVPRSAKHPIRGRPLWLIGMTHEAPITSHLPKREFWGPQYQESRQRLYVKLLATIRASLGTQSTLARSLRASLGRRFKA